MADTTALTAGLSKAGYEMSAFSTRAAALGGSLTKKLTLPIVGIGAVTAHLAKEFSGSMRLLQTQAGASAAEVDELKKSVLAMATEAGSQHGPNELAKALYRLKSVGMDNADAMDALKVAEQGASVGGAELEATTNAIAGAWKTGISGARSFKEAMGTLNAVIGAGNMRMDDLNAALGTGILTTAKTFGVGLQSVGAALATMTAQGQPAVQSATRLKTAISLMAAPTDAAQKALAGIGLSSTDLAKALRSGGIVEAIGLLRKHMEGLSQIDQGMLISKAFGGARGGGTIMALLQGYDDLIAKQDQIIQKGGEFAGAVAAQASGTGASWIRLSAVMQANAIMVGTYALPALTSLANQLTKVAQAFGRMDEPTRSFLVKAAVLAAALGPALFALSKLGALAFAVSSGITTLVSTVGALSAALSVGGIAAFGTTLLAAVGPVALITAGIVGAAGLLYGVKKLGESMKQTTASAKDMDDTLKAVQSDTDGKLQQWADKKLGGHLVVKKGQLTWEPKLDVKADTNKGAGEALAAGVREAEARRRQEIAQQTAETKAAYARSAAEIAQAYADMLKQNSLNQLGGPGSGANAGESAAVKAAQAEADRLKQIADEVSTSVRSSRASMGKDPVVIKARIDDLKDKVRDAKAQIKSLADSKGNKVEIALKKTQLNADIRAAQREIKNLTGKHHDVLVKAKIGDVKDKIGEIKTAIKNLGNVEGKPKLKADKTVLEAALKQARAKLKDLTGTTATPKAKLTDQATGPIRNIISLLGGIQDKTVTVTVNEKAGSKVPRRAQGGVFTKPHLALIAEDGPEAVVPLTKPGRAAAVLNEAGLSGSTRAAAGKAAGSAAKVAKAVADAVDKGVKGSKAKQKVKAASEMAGPIQTLLDFIANITESLETLERSTVPQLSSGWRAKVAAIVKKAAAVSKVVAAEINKAFPWGKASKDKEAKVGSKGERVQQAATMVGPVGELLSFVTEISESLTTISTATFPQLTDEIKANVRALAQQAAELAKTVALTLKEAFPRGISTTITEASSGSAQLLGDISGLLGTFSEMTGDIVQKALTGLGAVSGRWEELKPAILGLVIATRDAFDGMEVRDAVTQASSASASLLGDLANIISSVGAMTANAVQGGLDGLKNVTAAMPTFKEALPAVINAIRDALSGVTVEKALSDATAAVGQVVSDVTGLIGNLTAMTIEQVERGIGGAWTVGNRAKRLGEALTYMLAQITTAFGVADIKGLEDLAKVLQPLQEIASSLSGMVNSLMSVSEENVSNAMRGGMSIGQNFYNGLLTWKSNIVTLATEIANAAAGAMGGSGLAGAGAAGGAPITLNQTVINDSSTNNVNLPPAIAYAAVREIAIAVVAEIEARKAAAAAAAARGSVS